MMSTMATSESKRLKAVLYDMYVLAAAIRLLERSEGKHTPEDRDNAQVALATILVKSRSLIDFLQYSVKKTRPVPDIRASDIDSKYQPKAASDVIQDLRDSANKWAAHLTVRRVQHEVANGRRPRRRSAKTAATQVLSDAVLFVEKCKQNGVKLDTGALKYAEASVL